MKSSKVKKIISIVIVSIIVAIALTTVVLAIVPKRLYNPIVDGYYTVTVYNNKDTKYQYMGNNSSEEQKTFNTKLRELVDKSVKDNLLSAIFQGTGSFEVKVESTNQGNVMNKVANVDNAVCLVYNYLDDEQTLKFGDEVYINSQATTADKTVKFTKIFMPITNNDSFEECIVYLANSENTSNYQIKFLAHQADLYSYLTSLWDEK